MREHHVARRAVAAAPSLLSAARLILAAAFPWLGDGGRAGAIVAAALTDFADGYIARRFGVTHWVGGLLDTVADKAFVLTALLTFALEGRLAWWAVGLLLWRDAVVGFIAAYAAAHGLWPAFKQMDARPLGKGTTAALFVLFLALAVWGGESPAVAILWTLAVAMSLLAAVDYFLAFLRAEARRRRSPPPTAGGRGRESRRAGTDA